ncbi:unnamed protein product [Ectocarpus sp. 4 AP-2014]
MRCRRGTRRTHTTYIYGYISFQLFYLVCFAALKPSEGDAKKMDGDRSNIVKRGIRNVGRRGGGGHLTNRGNGGNTVSCRSARHPRSTRKNSRYLEPYSSPTPSCYDASCPRQKYVKLLTYRESGSRVN